MSAQSKFKEICEEFFGKEKALTGIEIGTASGIWTEFILRNMNIKRLYTIDPYKHFPNEKYEGGRPQEWHDRIKAVAEKRLNKYDNLHRIIATSERAFVKYFDRTNTVLEIEIDFVYIDGNHNHEYIKSDIFNYWSLLETGSIMAGHDWNLPQIQNAVNAFLCDYKINIDKKERIWWVYK